MHREPTFYETLGVESTAAIAEIRHAHRKLAQQNHPDKVHHLVIEFPWVEQEATQRFKLNHEAFNVLSDDTARSRYDAQLHQRWPDFVSRYAPPIYDPARSRRPSTETPKDSNDIHTRTSEDIAAGSARAKHVPFHRYSIPRRSPFESLEPRAEKRRKNVFLSALAFIAMLAVIYATSHYRQFDQQTSDWLMQQQYGTNTATPSTPAPDTAFPSQLQPLDNTPAKSPSTSRARPKPRSSARHNPSNH